MLLEVLSWNADKKGAAKTIFVCFILNSLSVHGGIHWEMLLCSGDNGSSCYAY